MSFVVIQTTKLNFDQNLLNGFIATISGLGL